MAIWRIEIDGVERLALGSPTAGPERLLPESMRLDALLRGSGASLADVASSTGEPIVSTATVMVLPPTDTQEIWAAGVTYERSRTARNEESRQGGDHYDQVYVADRPELFLKAAPGRSRGHDQDVCVRADSEWNVPEPELGVVCDSAGHVVAFVIGNDVSSRTIEGANPLYLPQAKVYTGSCAIGPCLVPVAEIGDPRDLTITLRITRKQEVLFEGSTSVATMRRSLEDLVSWLFRANDFPDGVVLLTGTGIVPGSEVSLEGGDVTEITVTGLGTLRNTVATTGA